jgi:hypothetical protein
MEDSSVDDIVEVFGEDLGLQPTVFVLDLRFNGCLRAVSSRNAKTIFSQNTWCWCWFIQAVLPAILHSYYSPSIDRISSYNLLEALAFLPPVRPFNGLLWTSRAYKRATSHFALDYQGN